MQRDNRRIYVDLDDVICGTTENYTSIAKQEFGRDVNFEDITSFDLQLSFGLTESEYAHFFELIHRPEILMGFRPVDGAQVAMKELESSGYEIAVVTGRPSSSSEISVEWLKENCIPFHSFTALDKYGRERGSSRSTSLETFLSERFLLAIEDSWDMARFISCKMETEVALFDKPWNRISSDAPGIHRIKGWNDIPDIVS